MKILMVCLGNICRSPIAEAILRHKADEKSLDIVVDSCGTANYHIGHPPDSRMIRVAQNNGIDISGLHARQFKPRDFDEFDIIYAMDENNLNYLQNMAKSNSQYEKVRLLLEENPRLNNYNVPDPYYGTLDDFIDVFKLLEDHLEFMLEKMK